jgi:hypothetical protein
METKNTNALLKANGITIRRETGRGFVARDAKGTEVARAGRKTNVLSLVVAAIFRGR